MGAVTLRILERGKNVVKGLYVSGGDTLDAVINALGAIGIDIKDEVYPLTVFWYTLIDGNSRVFH